MAILAVKPNPVHSLAYGRNLALAMVRADIYQIERHAGASQPAPEAC